MEPENVRHSFDSMSKGDQCPDCPRGKVYKYEPAVMVRVTGQAPYSAKRHIRDRLRCSACGAVFSADLPAEVLADGEPGQLYGNSARSVMAISKCLAGEPYYRQQSVQSLYGIKLSASTIFDQCEYAANDLQPVWREVLKLAANAQVFYIDDTTNRISDQNGMYKPKRGTDKLQWRTGVYSSAMLAVYDDVDETGMGCKRRLVLYQTSIGHAGEWADEVLGPRDSSLPPPTVISDALSSNRVSVVEVLDAKCNVHSRRNFVEVRSHFPSGMDAILELYRQIWVNDAHCRNEQHSDEQRQQYHHTHSLPVMQTLQGWFEYALSEKTQDAVLPPLDSTVPESLHHIEPNSSLGAAMSYLLNHYDKLTQYCHYPGIPIDNNEIERLIKLVVRNRKNAGYFRTQAGAWVGDMLTSMIAICQENGVNAFEYLTAIQCNRVAVRANPGAWLPWNYTQSV
ncbi:IS66 family transposase [Granulosicoccus antarcticus]|nr:IS66 family transposase [Granulosicoccus antarcticus]